MRSVRSASTVASKLDTTTPFVFFFVFFYWDLECASYRRPRGRPSTKKEVKTSKYVDDEDEAWVFFFSFLLCLWPDIILFSVDSDDDMKSVRSTLRYGLWFYPDISDLFYTKYSLSS
jgi:hypothetical protein